MTENSDEQKGVDSALDFLLSATESAPQKAPKMGRRIRLFFALCVFFIALPLALSIFLWRAPAQFPSDSLISVRDGATLQEVSTLLGERGAVRSPFWFKAWSILLGGNGGLKAGDYYLSGPVPVYTLAERFTAGLQGLTAVTVTIPEGLSNVEVAKVLLKSLPRLNKERFLNLAKAKEGYLFPDTYAFLPNEKEEDVIAEMEQNFRKRTETLAQDIKLFGKPLRDIVTMASLIEGEARTPETRRQISGILWKRLALGMPLQVDAVFPYILGKNTFEVTTDDLKVDSPYNTYKYAGLPPGPINNPGLDAITATITPTPTKYLYYLSDKDGVMHYAITHEEHLRNREKYLGK
ncbi:MAG: endolytic transglycosylase MltG [bacterium]|nr:endolytic transglycosylase MltG [bacterium]